MNVVDEAALLVRLARWGITLARHDIGFPSPVPDNPKFLSPRAAVRLIRDNDVVAVSGLGTHQRASILFWALRDSFSQYGHPRRLTLINLGGHGSRGLLPGTLDELARPGLCTRLISGHFETNHDFLALAAAGECELQCLPLGVIALLFEHLRHGHDSIVLRTGVGTFLDPRQGAGSAVTGRGEPLIVPTRGGLRFHLPPVDVALFNVPAADRHGNLYIRDCVTVGDGLELAHAAKRNGGRVIANVGRIVDEGYDRIFLPARMVDAIAFHPDTEQTAGFFHRDPWKALTLTTAPSTEVGPGSRGGRSPAAVRTRTEIAGALEQARFTRWLGELTGGMSQRQPIDEVLYRLAALTLSENTPRGARVVIGAGLPEEVCRVVHENGHLDRFTFMVETGVIGGLPAPGIYFGASFAPRQMLSPAAFFRQVYKGVDAACLGALEVDAAGNVNVSRRGAGIRQFAGPGGFTDFVTTADTLVFICEWMRGGAIEIVGDQVRISRRGRPKFVSEVREVTFAAAPALRAGKRVFYVTPVGVFRLTKRGIELCRVLPGIDIERDIRGMAAMNILLPRGPVPQAPGGVVTGSGAERWLSDGAA